MIIDRKNNVFCVCVCVLYEVRFIVYVFIMYVLVRIYLCNVFVCYMYICMCVWLSEFMYAQVSFVFMHVFYQMTCICLYNKYICIFSLCLPPCQPIFGCKTKTSITNITFLCSGCTYLNPSIL